MAYTECKKRQNGARVTSQRLLFIMLFGVPKMIDEKTDGGDVVPSADNLHDKWYKTGAVAPLGI